MLALLAAAAVAVSAPEPADEDPDACSPASSLVLSAASVGLIGFASVSVLGQDPSALMLATPLAGAASWVFDQSGSQAPSLRAAMGGAVLGGLSTALVVWSLRVLHEGHGARELAAGLVVLAVTVPLAERLDPFSNLLP